MYYSNEKGHSLACRPAVQLQHLEVLRLQCVQRAHVCVCVCVCVKAAHFTSSTQVMVGRAW